MRIRYKKDIRIVFPLLRKGETGQCIGTVVPPCWHSSAIALAQSCQCGGTNDNINKLVRTYVANINRYNYELE